ncbi:hypothetical protein H0H81_007329 [Sphagnurus paluster]|uniref:Histone deacetylase 8 n=1 Tax=Sphagnurus paluster TaxID=117069 RepID=A0A9P7KGR5_9AGAR|nr:hypothetical protein H0H81_007329 [Sphagnurus paluster]
MSNIVAYIVSRELIAASSQLPSNRGRSVAVHALIHALRLSKHPHLLVLRPTPASRTALTAFHTRSYIDAVNSKKASEGDSDSSSDIEDAFGFDSDCPRFPLLASYVELVAGAVLTGAESLIDGRVGVAIAWDGGRHHARKDRAAGFCYVADCVLALMRLKRTKQRIMYIDLDVHYSDGVSDAFREPTRTREPQILTLSIHHAAPGFFPPSPYAALPTPTSDPYSLSLPLHLGFSAATFGRVWRSVRAVRSAYDPAYVVLQCGADALAGDPCGVANWCLSSADPDGMGMLEVVADVLSWERVDALGEKLGERLPSDTPIPDHQQFPIWFILKFVQFDVPPGTMQDTNAEADAGYLQEVEACYDRVVQAINTRRAAGR